MSELQSSHAWCLNFFAEQNWEFKHLIKESQICLFHPSMSHGTSVYFFPNWQVSQLYFCPLLDVCLCWADITLSTWWQHRENPYWKGDPSSSFSPEENGQNRTSLCILGILGSEISVNSTNCSLSTSDKTQNMKVKINNENLMTQWKIMWRTLHLTM